MLIYINGKFVESSEAVISPYDHGYLYGLGVFETFRIYEGHAFLFQDHYERLTTALSCLHVEWHMTMDEAWEIIKELLVRNDFRNAYIRFNVSAGAGEIGLQTEAYEQPSIIVFIKPLPPAGDAIEKEGVILEQRRNTPEGSFRLKSHHYLNNILGKREIGQDLGKEGIFLTESGYVAEGIVSNVFFVKNGILYTPSLETGILNGITRQFILALAKEQGISCKEGLFTEQELLSGDEIFVTNSIQEIVPIRSLRSHAFPGKNGELTRQLIAAYQQYRHKLWSKFELSERRG